MAIDPLPQPPWSTYYFDGWTYSRARLELTNPDAVKILLSTLEHQTLRTFLEHPQVILSRDFLFKRTSRLGGVATVQELRRIDIVISRLRHKIETNSSCPDLIKTVRHEGYYFTAMPEPRASPYPSGIHMAQFAPNSPVVDE